MRVFAICVASGLGLLCVGKAALWFVGMTPVAQAMGGWTEVPLGLWLRLAAWIMGAIASLVAAVMLASPLRRNPPA
jgi:hypothetical protein